VQMIASKLVGSQQFPAIDPEKVRRAIEEAV